MSEIVHVPFRDGEILAVDVNGKPWVVMRPALESIGLSFPTQLRKLRNRSWAVVAQRATTGADGKTYEMTIVDLRTFLMLLATVSESSVAEAIRPKLIAYQREVADVIERHFMRLHGRGEDPTNFTWTLDETCAILRQRYHLDLNAHTIGQQFRTAGIWKQNGTPTSKWDQCFHFTGTAWTVLPISIARIGKRLLKIEHQIQQGYAIQLRLQLEGVGRGVELEQLSTDDV